MPPQSLKEWSREAAAKAIADEVKDGADGIRAQGSTDGGETEEKAETDAEQPQGNTVSLIPFHAVADPYSEELLAERLPEEHAVLVPIVDDYGRLILLPTSLDTNPLDLDVPIDTHLENVMRQEILRRLNAESSTIQDCIRLAREREAELLREKAEGESMAKAETEMRQFLFAEKEWAIRQRESTAMGDADAESRAEETRYRKALQTAVQHFEEAARQRLDHAGKMAKNRWKLKGRANVAIHRGYRLALPAPHREHFGDISRANTYVVVYAEAVNEIPGARESSFNEAAEGGSAPVEEHGDGAAGNAADGMEDSALKTWSADTARRALTPASVAAARNSGVKSWLEDEVADIGGASGVLSLDSAASAHWPEEEIDVMRQWHGALLDVERDGWVARSIAEGNYKLRYDSDGNLEIPPGLPQDGSAAVGLKRLPSGLPSFSRRSGNIGVGRTRGYTHKRSARGRYQKDYASQVPMTSFAETGVAVAAGVNPQWGARAGGSVSVGFQGKARGRQRVVLWLEVWESASASKKDSEKDSLVGVGCVELGKLAAAKHDRWRGMVDLWWDHLPRFMGQVEVSIALAAEATNGVGKKISWSTETLLEALPPQAWGKGELSITLHRGYHLKNMDVGKQDPYGIAWVEHCAVGYGDAREEDSTAADTGRRSSRRSSRLGSITNRGIEGLETGRRSSTTSLGSQHSGKHTTLVTAVDSAGVDAVLQDFAWQPPRLRRRQKAALPVLEAWSSRKINIGDRLPHITRPVQGMWKKHHEGTWRRADQFAVSSVVKKGGENPIWEVDNVLKVAIDGDLTGANRQVTYLELFDKDPNSDDLIGVGALEVGPLLASGCSSWRGRVTLHSEDGREERGYVEVSCIFDGLVRDAASKDVPLEAPAQSELPPQLQGPLQVIAWRGIRLKNLDRGKQDPYVVGWMEPCVKGGPSMLDAAPVVTLHDDDDKATLIPRLGMAHAHPGRKPKGKPSSSEAADRAHCGMTEVIPKGGENPVWGEEKGKFMVECRGDAFGTLRQVLYLEAFDRDRFSADDLIGYGAIEIGALVAYGAQAWKGRVQLWSKDGKEQRGELEVSLAFQGKLLASDGSALPLTHPPIVDIPPTPHRAYGTVFMNIVRGLRLLNKDVGKQDPMVVVYVESNAPPASDNAKRRDNINDVLALPVGTASAYPRRVPRGKWRSKYASEIPRKCYAETQVHKKGGTDPVWGDVRGGRQSVEFEGDLTGEGRTVIYLEAWDWDRLSANDLIGVGRIEIAPLLLEGVPRWKGRVQLWTKKGKRPAGELDVTLEFQGRVLGSKGEEQPLDATKERIDAPALQPRATGALNVTVHRGVRLENMDKGKQDPYVVVWTEPCALGHGGLEDEPSFKALATMVKDALASGGDMKLTKATPLESSLIDLPLDADAIDLHSAQRRTRQWWNQNISPFLGLGCLPPHKGRQTKGKPGKPLGTDDMDAGATEVLYKAGTDPVFEDMPSAKMKLKWNGEVAGTDRHVVYVEAFDWDRVGGHDLIGVGHVDLGPLLHAGYQSWHGPVQLWDAAGKEARGMVLLSVDFAGEVKTVQGERLPCGPPRVLDLPPVPSRMQGSVQLEVIRGVELTNMDKGKQDPYVVVVVDQAWRGSSLADAEVKLLPSMKQENPSELEADLGSDSEDEGKDEERKDEDGSPDPDGEEVEGLETKEGEKGAIGGSEDEDDEEDEGTGDFASKPYDPSLVHVAWAGAGACHSLRPLHRKIDPKKLSKLDKARYGCTGTHKKGGTAPTWGSKRNGVMKLDIDGHGGGGQREVIYFEAYDYDRFSSDDLIGTGRLEIATLVAAGMKKWTGFIQLWSHNGKQKRGEIEVSLNLDIQVVPA